MTKQALVGLIGGMSWESSVQYYRLINEGVRDRLGGVASARTLMWSFDFARIEALQHAGDWDALAGDGRGGQDPAKGRRRFSRAVHQHLSLIHI